MSATGESVLGKAMGKYVNLGNSGFASIRNSTYVDKTGLIAEINHTLDSGRKLTCISRPRRFGKSYAAKMLCAYYDHSCDSGALFEGLQISLDPSFLTHLNRYPVLYLDITWFLSTVPEGEELLTYLQDQVVQELRKEFPSEESTHASSLAHILADYVEATGHKLIIIIDEWDAIFREQPDAANLQERYMELLRALFKSPLTDSIFHAAYMTGILPIKKYGHQSAISDFHEYTMVNPAQFAPYIGFTDADVKELCAAYDMDYDAIKAWYDGYRFPEAFSVYNPSSVVSAVERRLLDSYWAKTETYEALRTYIDMNFDGLREALVSMLGGQSVPADVSSFQNDLTSIRSKDDVLTLLVHLGYLGYDARAESVFIPNREVQLEFLRTIKQSGRTELIRLIAASDRIYRETLAMNGDAVASAVGDIHETGVAPIAYNDESTLRYVIRFAYLSCVDDYVRVEELPAGHGYADILYLPRSGSTRPALLVELKWNKTAESAIEQIKMRRYFKALSGYAGKILLVGINYDSISKEHSCAIEMI